MAKLSSGILGPVNGKVGNVVGFNWKGINALRIYTIPSNPKTASQELNRSKFSSVVGFCKTLTVGFSKYLWNPGAVRESGYNRLVRLNMATPGDTLTAESARFFDGTLNPPAIDGVTVAGNTVTVVFEDRPAGLLDTDKFVVVGAYMGASGEVLTFGDAIIYLESKLCSSIGTGALPDVQIDYPVEIDDLDGQFVLHAGFFRETASGSYLQSVDAVFQVSV